MWLVVFLLLVLSSVAHGQTLSARYMGLYNALLSADTCDYSTLNSAVSAAASANKSIIVSPTDVTQAACTWTITTSLSVPITRQLYVPFGSVMNLSSGVTLTACIDAGDYAIFTGDGDLRLPTGCTKPVKAAWFDKTSAGLNKADSAAVAAGAELYISNGVWDISTSVTIDSQLTVPYGAYFDIADGDILTLVKCPMAGDYRIFNRQATGLITLQSCDSASPKWTGALADGSTDDSAEWQFLIDSGVKGIRVPAGSSVLDSALTYYDEQRFFCESSNEACNVTIGHAGVGFAPDDLTGCYRGIQFDNLHIIREGLVGSGDAIRLSHVRKGHLSKLRIEGFDRGINFTSGTNAACDSFFNTLTDLEITANTTSAIVIAGATDPPNVNFLNKMDLRGGTTILDLVDGATNQLVNVSIQGATAGGHWLRNRVNANATQYWGMRFENSTDLGPGLGVLIEAPNVAFHGGTISKGNYMPYRGTDGPTVWIGGKQNGDGITTDNKNIIEDGTQNNRSWQDIWSGCGLYQNYIQESKDLQTSPWVTSGTGVTLTANNATVTDPRGLNEADLLNITSATGSGRQQDTGIAAVVGQSYTSAFYMRTLAGQGNAVTPTPANGPFTVRVTDGVATTTRQFFITDEWRRFWFWHTAGSTGNLVFQFRRQDSGELQDVLIWEVQMNDGKFPGPITRTEASALTNVEYRCLQWPMIDARNQSIIVKRASVCDDTIFDDPTDGLICMDADTGQLMCRNGGVWAGC